MDLASLDRALIVSCQPVAGGPMDREDIVVAMSQAALAGGAGALRIESGRYVASVRAATAAPIIGLVKRDLDDSPVRITPLLDDVAALADAGADVIAFDATRRERPVPVARLVHAIGAAGCFAMADCATIEDGREALEAGATILGTTLSGYTGGPEPEGPDYALVAALRALTPHVVAEGRIRTPSEAAEALRRGAWSVVVGSAITRPEHVVAWFRDAMVRADDGHAA